MSNTQQWEALSDEERQPYLAKAAEILSDHYTCTRVWGAWSYGTMGPDDFCLASEDDDIVSDAAKILYEFVTQRRL
jgi:hypothetical protein